MRAPTPREQAAIMGASYALVTLALRAWAHLAQWRVKHRAEGGVIPAARYGSSAPMRRYFSASDGNVFIGPPDWIAEVRARYAADRPTAN